MTSQFALSICILFILWLLYRDRTLRPMTSWSLWIPLLWVMIIGSRSISTWFGMGSNIEQPADYLDGSPLDRNVFLLLIIAGIILLWRRRVDWSRIFESNRWLFLFFLYCGLSVMWSDYPFVSVKRWIKDLGNVIMVIIILTENDPFQATKALFARYTSFALPLSVVFIKYFPDLGRYYGRWTGEPAYCGITTNKNELGIILMVSGLFLFLDLLEPRERSRDKLDLSNRVLLLLMMIWLIGKAGSSTSLVCLVLGAVTLFFMRFPVIKQQVRRHLGIYTLAAGFLIFIIQSFPVILDTFLTMIGRDTTLTGRTNIWKDVLSEPVNLFVGTGYKSFWLGPAMERLQLNQAHNGYLETYLNGGFLGLGLLLAMIITTGSKLRNELMFKDSFSIVRFSFFIVAILYNWTEAMFNGLSLIWFVLLIASLSYVPSTRTALVPRLAARKLSRAPV